MSQSLSEGRAKAKEPGPLAQTIAAVILLGGLWLVCNSMCPSSSDSVSDPSKTDDHGARYAGQQFAKNLCTPHLRAPSTAEWPWESVTATPLSDVTEKGKRYRRWRVTGAVDAQNAFGAMIRTEWSRSRELPTS